MRAHFLHHVPFESPGHLELLLQKAGGSISTTALFDSPHLPNLSDFDLLIILGGPMSVNDEDMFPWLIMEKDFIRTCIQHHKPVLGICLGAQLIAAALGASVYKNIHKEIGWFPIQSLTPPHEGTFLFPDTMTAFHWHGETFDIPEGAVALASSAATSNQAFQYGTTTIALQFHLEATPETINALVANCAHELSPADFVQSKEAILAHSPTAFNTIHAVLEDIICYLTAQKQV